MIGLIRLVVFGFLAMSVVYVLLSIYSRSVRRETLEKQWDADHPAGELPDERAAHIEAGMRAYEKSLRRKLIWLVYVIPTIIVIVLLYLNET